MTAEEHESDYLLDAAWEQWPAIRMIYAQFADARPVMLFDIQTQQIYAYPYIEFRMDLSLRSQRLLEKQYRTATENQQMVIFVSQGQHAAALGLVRGGLGVTSGCAFA